MRAEVVCYRCIFFFFQAEDGIRDLTVTGVQTCALPIFPVLAARDDRKPREPGEEGIRLRLDGRERLVHAPAVERPRLGVPALRELGDEIGRASCRERV